MGTTGVIFAVIAIAWLAYLVPHFARRRDGESEATAVDPSTRFSDSVQIVRSADEPSVEEPAEYEVSTPQVRTEALAELHRLDRLAARRRRRVLLVLLAVNSVVVAACALGWISWWSTAASGGLLVAFAVVARLSVRVMHRNLDTRRVAILEGSNEPTMLLRKPEKARKKAKAAKSEPAAASTEAAKPGSLWDPVPVTTPTYVSRPLAPRTVRTIDLSGPNLGSGAGRGVPVTADAPEPEVVTGPVLSDPVLAERENPEAASA